MPTDDPPDAGTTRILAGIVVGGRAVPADVADAVARIAAEPGVDAVVLIGTRPASDPWARAGRLFRLYRALDRRVFRPARDPDRIVPLGLDVQATVPDALDVLIVLDGQTAPPAAVARARHGTWRAGHDRGTAFQALAHGRATVVSSLVQVSADRAPVTRYRSVGPVDRFSLARTEGPLRWKAAAFPARALAAVRRDGWAGSAPATAPVEAPQGTTPPTTTAMIGFLTRLTGRITGRVVQRLLTQNEWFVAYRRRIPGAPPPSDLGGFTPIVAPPGTFYADPFVIADAGAHRLFVEVVPRATGRGAIAELRLDDERRGVWPATTIIERPFHLSYPFVIRDGGDLLMIPESGDHGTTTAYRHGSEVPGWTPDGVILPDTHAYDPTVVWHDGMYWLFVAIQVPGGSPWDELCVFHGPSVRGPWTAHPANPVVSDVRSARPAGRIFEHAGQLIRPAQDCSGAYGRRVVLQRIVQLDRDHYEERPWSTIEPTGIRGVRRTHTYTFDGSYETVDGFRHRGRWSRPRHRAPA